MSAAVQQAPAFSPTPSQLAVAYSVCRSIARASARNFYYAFLALPKAKLQALCAVYGFMRRCDNATVTQTESLGVDCKLTSKIREEWEDAARGSVYHPEEELDNFDGCRSDKNSTGESTQLRMLVRFMADPPGDC